MTCRELSHIREESILTLSKQRILILKFSSKNGHETCCNIFEKI